MDSYPLDEDIRSAWRALIVTACPACGLKLITGPDDGPNITGHPAAEAYTPAPARDGWDDRIDGAEIMREGGSVVDGAGMLCCPHCPGPTPVVYSGTVGDRSGDD